MSSQSVTVRFQCAENHPPEIFELEAQLEETVDQFDDAEYEISVFHAKGVLNVYGSDADRLYAAIHPLLLATPCMKGAIATLRYGPAEDRGAREAVVTIAPLT